jgi:hypothetical protein
MCLFGTYCFFLGIEAGFMTFSCAGGDLDIYPSRNGFPSHENDESDQQDSELGGGRWMVSR